MTKNFSTKMNKPTVNPLSRGQRRFVFLGLVFIFLLTVPMFVFYATGYRYDFFSPTGGLTTTGGLYISILSENGELFLDEKPVQDVRIFRKASYIQNITPGVHRIHVQEEGMQTWVKELPIYPYMVTEAEAFLFPKRPQVRLITEYQTATGSPIYLGMSSSTKILPFASTSLPILITKNRATSTLTLNSEYSFILALFNEQTKSTSTLLKRMTDEISSAFVFSNPQTKVSASSSAELATTTRLYRDIKLYERGGEIYAKYVGAEQDIPYYFCVPQSSLASTTELYGAQVMKGVVQAMEESALLGTTETANKSRICRSEIKIDTKGHKVIYFDFFPNNGDLVLLQLDNGIFVVEIDDRSWQNSQQLYPASAEKIIVNNGIIYVKDHGIYFELLTKLLVF